MVHISKQNLAPVGTVSFALKKFLSDDLMLINIFNKEKLI
jgi:hypothetical protein